jgi:hypothetical protein
MYQKHLTAMLLHAAIPYEMHKSPVLHGIAVLVSASAIVMFSGCATHNLNAGTVTVPTTLSPDSFPWEVQSLEVTGRAKAPGGLDEPQRSIAGRRSAKTDSIAKLKEEVGALRVTADGVRISQAMQNNLGLRHALEHYLQKAEVLRETPVANNQFEVQVRLPLAPVGDILRQYNITPQGVPDIPAGDESNMPTFT